MHGLPALTTPLTRMVHLLPRINLHQHITITQCPQSSLGVWFVFKRHLMAWIGYRVMSSRLNVELGGILVCLFIQQGLDSLPLCHTSWQKYTPVFLNSSVFLKQRPYPRGSREDRQTYNLTLGSVISKSGEERERSLCQGNIRNMRKWGSEPSEYPGQ